MPVTSDALLADIVANPDDDAPRRVYADALLERGDPYGEFINVQLDLAGDGLARAERIRRRIREDELLAIHRASWIDTFEIAKEVRYRRGFVDELTLDADTLARKGSEVLARAPLLRIVNLEISTRNRSKALARWSKALASPVLPRLAGLQVGVYYTPPHDYEESIPEAMAMLAEAAEHWPLVALSMSGVRGTSLDQFATSALVRRLRWIDLERQRSSEAARILATISRGQLRGVRLGLCFDHRVLAEPLRSLAVEGKQAEHVRAIANAPGLVQLRELDLGTAPWDSVQELANARRLDSLRVLRCRGRLSQFEVAAMLEWPLVKRLEVLDLRGMPAAARHRGELARRCDGVLLVGARSTTAVLGECW